MRFVFLYRGGNVPKEKFEEHMTEWGEYAGGMVKRGEQKAGQPFAGGKLVTSTSVKNYASYIDDDMGYSEIECPNMEAAVALAQKAPNVKFGGTVEVREVMPM